MASFLDRAVPTRPTSFTDQLSLTAVEAVGAVCRLLRQRGWTARLANFGSAGDADFRLEAVVPDGAVSVELLCPFPDGTGTGRWHAARIRLDGERAVWRGPGQTAAPDALLAFIDDLARQPERVLAQRYLCCG